jgi:hypothetical protein
MTLRCRNKNNIKIELNIDLNWNEVTQHRVHS